MLHALLFYRYTYNIIGTIPHICRNDLTPTAPMDRSHRGMGGRCQDNGALGHVIGNYSGAALDPPWGIWAQISHKFSGGGQCVETQSSFHHSIGILNPRYSEVNGKVRCNLLANSMRLHSKLDLKFNL